MKNIIKILILLFAFHLNAQGIIKHVANTQNTKGHITTINNRLTNGKSTVILIVSQNYGAYNSNEIGVWYSAGKWKIFNQNRKPIPMKAKFNIMVIPPNTGKSFVHTTTAKNTSGHITTLLSRLTNAKPNALVYVTQNFGKNNTSNVGVWYSGGKWKIYNENTAKKMPLGTKFNVLVLHPGNNRIGNSNLYGFKYTNSSTGHVSKVKSPIPISKSAIVFATQNWKKPYNPNVTGVWYNGKNWTTYNQNRKPISKGVRFNIIAVKNTRRPSPINDPIIRDHRPNNNIEPAYTGLIRIKPFILTSTGSTERLGPNASSLPEKFSPKINREEFSLFKEIFNIQDNIFGDINAKSNIYYYVPANYSLKWKKETNDYDFNIHYNASTEEGGRGKVNINVELTANIDAEDIKIAEAYLSSKLRKKTSLLSMDLRENPKVDFGSFASNYDVNPETLSTSVPTDYQQPIILNWRMDSGVDNFVSSMFNSSSGDVMINFKPYADSISSVPRIKDILVPINLKVNDHKTYGKIKFNTLSELTNGWINYLDYPVIPKKLIVLIKKGSTQSLKAISLTRETIASNDTYSFKGSISDSQYIKKIWLDYEIDSECDECNKKVKIKIIGGTSGSQIANVSIEVINPLAYSKANSIKVYIKSIQVDPNGLNETELKPFHINEDAQTISDIQLFVPQGKELEYNYKVVMIMNDGDVLNSDWKKTNTDILVLGEKQINSLFPDKKKNEILDNAKESAIEKLKDTLLGKGATEEDVINKAADILGNLFKKKKDKKKEGNNEEENNDN